jgi:hypothetical protein
VTILIRLILYIIYIAPIISSPYIIKNLLYVLTESTLSSYLAKVQKPVVAKDQSRKLEAPT